MFTLSSGRLPYVTLPCISESSLKIRINLDFYFYISLCCLKIFYEVLKSLHKIFWGTKKKCEYKNSFLFVRDRGEKGKALRSYVELRNNQLSNLTALEKQKTKSRNIFIAPMF